MQLDGEVSSLISFRLWPKSLKNYIQLPLPYKLCLSKTRNAALRAIQNPPLFNNPQTSLIYLKVIVDIVKD